MCCNLICCYGNIISFIRRVFVPMCIMVYYASASIIVSVFGSTIWKLVCLSPIHTFAHTHMHPRRSFQIIDAFKICISSTGTDAPRRHVKSTNISIGIGIGALPQSHIADNTLGHTARIRRVSPSVEGGTTLRLFDLIVGILQPAKANIKIK